MFLKNKSIVILATLISVLTIVISSLWLLSYSRPLVLELPVGLHGDSAGLFFFRGSWRSHLQGLHPFYRNVGSWVLFAERPTKNEWYLCTVDRRTGDFVRFKPDYPGYFVFTFGFKNYLTEKVEQGIRIQYSEPEASLTIFLNPADGSITYEEIKLPMVTKRPTGSTTNSWIP